MLAEPDVVIELATERLVRRFIKLFVSTQHALCHHIGNLLHRYLGCGEYLVIHDGDDHTGKLTFYKRELKVAASLLLLLTQPRPWSKPSKNTAALFLFHEHVCGHFR